MNSRRFIFAPSREPPVQHVSKVFCAAQHNGPINVADGSKADTTLFPFDVRFTPESGHWLSTEMSALGHKQTHALQQ